MCWLHSKLCIIEPSATRLRAVANTMPRWKGEEHDNKSPATRETCAARIDSDALANQLQAG